MAYKTGNPALNAETFDKQQAVAGPPMTLEGTVQKSFLLICIVIATAAYSWYTFTTGTNQGGIMAIAGGSALVGFVLALIMIFKKETSPYLSWFYAAFEGLCLGAISAAYETQFHGIVLNAVGLTFGTFLAMLAAYQSKLIKPTENFKLGVFAATGGVALLYIFDMIGRAAFHVNVPFLHDNTPVGIAISGVIVVIAALNLVLDFDFIEVGVQRGAPKYMEWYASFGLLVTLVWLYMEILRMLSKSRSR